MKTRTSSNVSRKAPQGREGEVSTQSPAKRYEVIKLGVDTHGGQYTFARMIDQLGMQPPQSMAPDCFIEFLKKQQALAKRVVMVYEAGPYGFSLYRQATEMGVECLVCAPERLSRGASASMTRSTPGSCSIVWIVTWRATMRRCVWCGRRASSRRWKGEGGHPTLRGEKGGGEKGDIPPYQEGRGEGGHPTLPGGEKSGGRKWGDASGTQIVSA